MKKSGSNGRAIAVPAAVLLVSVLVCRAQSSPSPQESRLAVATQKTRSLSEVEAFLRDYKDGIVNEAEVLKWLSLRQGLDFKADPETLDKLRNEGATDVIIEEIKKRAKKEEVPTTLSLSCAPAECRIKINGQPAGVTSDGVLVKIGLPPGEVTVDFEKEGYITGQKIVKVSAEPSPPTSVTLEPTPATMAVHGKKLYAMMVAALGGTAALKNLRSLTGSGSITSYKDGKPSGWDFDVAMYPPHLIEMKVTNSEGALHFGCNGEKCGEMKKGFLILKGGTKLPAAVVSELEPNLRIFTHYDLISIWEALNSPSVRLTAHTADVHGKPELHLHAAGDDHVYELTIGPDALPTSVEDNPRSGLGAVKVTYGDYVKVSDYQYPKHTTIRGSGESGIEVRLDRVDLGSKLRPSDFPK